MSSYTHFTEEEKEQARNTDLVSFLRYRGETLKHSGSEHEWKSDNGKVTIRGNLWFHQYEREGGAATMPDGKALPQGIVVGCTGGKKNTTAMIDTRMSMHWWLERQVWERPPTGCIPVSSMPVPVG